VGVTLFCPNGIILKEIIEPLQAAIAQRSKSHIVTKLRDKGTAREIRKQLDDYLSSLDKADKSVFEWEMRVAEIGEEMKKVQGSRHNAE
jgi:hypothetical protein